jgi:hypothetical protein
MLLQPTVCFHNLIGIGGGREDLCQQRIGIQRDRRHKLLQLFWRLLRGLNWYLRRWLVRLGEPSRHSG